MALGTVTLRRAARYEGRRRRYVLFVPILRRGGTPMDANTPTMTGATAGAGPAADEEPPIHILWINAGLSCDGDSVSLTAATQPSIEEIALGALPGLPKIAVHWPLIDFECGPVQRRGHLHRVVLQGRPRRARTVRAGRRGLDPQRVDQARGLLVRLRQRPGDRAADHHQRVARPARRRRRWPWSPSAPARPTAASTRWRATPPGRWACRTTWAGTGSPRPASRSCACRAARSSRTTSPRR